MQVSVILPIYNGEKTLAATLDSLVKQTFQDFELIACIDGSFDNSLAILQSFSNKFKALKILQNQKNLGLGPTMNKLVYSANGEYIAVVEQDDVYYPQRLEKQVRILNAKAEIGLVSGIADFWDGQKITSCFPGLLVNGSQYPKKEEMFLLNYRNQIKVVNSCMMFRKAIHIENGLYFSKHYPSISIDWTYVLRFCLHSDIYGINDSLVRVDRRLERNSITSNKKNQFAATHEVLRSFLFEYPNLIKKRDYKFAKTTQHLMELSHQSKWVFPFIFLKYWLQNPWDKRWIPYLKRKLF
jgi:glycosyltransferase involved in cell wall biosynthesis